ncbi:hypothetical protein V2O64_17260 [Verrucomicrobiaceae bacterium 227]
MKTLLALLALASLTSCYQNTLQGKAEQTADRLFQRPTAPPVVAQWMLFTQGRGHRLDVVANGKRTSVSSGLPYQTGKRIDPTMAGSVSAFRIDYPDGGYEIYELIPKGGSQSEVHMRSYDLQTRTMNPSKVLATIPN